MKTRTKKFTMAVLLAIVALSAGFAPQFMSAKGYVYVDDSYKGGNSDGSSSKPFTKIQDAITKAKKEHKNVFIKEGTYTENIIIYKDVEVDGENEDDVVIIAANKNKTVVEMEDDTEIQRVTIKGGERGIEVKKNAEAEIERCTVTDNKKDGIKVMEGDTDDRHLVEIKQTKMNNNGWNGLYAEERKITLMHNEFNDNGRDGLELVAGTEGYLEDNQVRLNKGDGLEVTVDGSEIWTKNNTFYDNGENGVQINAKEKSGKVGFESSKFYKNDDYGIAKVEKAAFSDQQWNDSIVMKTKNLFWDNHDGTISPVINQY